MKATTVIEIVRIYLEDNGFDGLYCNFIGCDGCSYTNIQSCMKTECMPGYRQPCGCYGPDEPKEK